jgi:hypothetical protein
MPFAALAAGIASLVASGSQALISIRGAGGSAGAVTEQGARITNAIESAMDLNRWAFASGVIPHETFETNYRQLWGDLENAAQQISAYDGEYARRMLADRVPGGKFSSTWQGVLHDDLVRAFVNTGRLDPYGYVLPQWQWPWPEKTKYYEVPPLDTFQIPNHPEVGETAASGAAAAGPSGAGVIGPINSTYVLAGLGVAAVIGVWLVSSR